MLDFKNFFDRNSSGINNAPKFGRVEKQPHPFELDKKGQAVRRAARLGQWSSKLLRQLDVTGPSADANGFVKTMNSSVLTVTLEDLPFHPSFDPKDFQYAKTENKQHVQMKANAALWLHVQGKTSVIERKVSTYTRHFQSDVASFDGEILIECGACSLEKLCTLLAHESRPSLVLIPYVLGGQHGVRLQRTLGVDGDAWVAKLRAEKATEDAKKEERARQNKETWRQHDAKAKLHKEMDQMRGRAAAIDYCRASIGVVLRSHPPADDGLRRAVDDLLRDLDKLR